MVIDRQRLQDDAYRQEVLAALMHDYQDTMLHYCVVRLGELHGEEVAQDVFVAAWETLPQFRHEAPISAWPFGIARKKCAQAFRNRTHRAAIARAFVDDIRQQAHAESPTSPEHGDTTQTQLAQLTDGLDMLRRDDRIVLTLRYTKGMAVLDIADVLGKSEAAVRKQLLRALQRLREIIHDGTAG